MDRLSSEGGLSFCRRLPAAPGQFAVLYDGDVCLGGGVIA